MNETPADLPKPLRHYVVVRSDLPLGQKFAQLVHAAGESAVLGTPPDNKTIAVALEGTLHQFNELLDFMQPRGIKHVQVYETDGEFAGELMAIGIEPTRLNPIRKALFHFKQCGGPAPE